MTTRAGRLIRGAVLALVLAAPAFSQGLTEGPTRQVDPTGALMPRVTQDPALVPADAPVGPVNGTAAEKAGETQAVLDYDAWGRMADRAEAAIGDVTATSLAIEHIRALLVDWRAAFLDAQNANELDYYLLPRLDLPEQEIRVCNRNSANFECFRFDDLNFFYGMSERERLQRKF